MKVLDGTQEKNVNYSWEPGRNSVMEVAESEIFTVLVPDSSMGQITENTGLAEMNSLDDDRFDGAAGPLKVAGANPGDTLELEILDIKTSKWGWSASMGMIGLLKGEMENALVIWDIGEQHCTARGDFLKGIRVPKRPFLGITGTSPDSGKYGMIPPRYFGGNMDNPLLSKGSKLYLPVNEVGGMISFGDLHAAQGNGEVCGTAVEASGTLTARIRIYHKEKISFPRAGIPGRYMPDSLVTMGISGDLREASKIALREMMDELGRMRGLSEIESYILCSVAGNLHISEIVDEPNFVVSMSLPKDIF